MNLWIGITTAPRKDSTLDVVLESILDQYDKYSVLVFAEPNTQIDKTAEDYNFNVWYIHNEKQLWCVWNRVNTLKYFIEETKAEYIRINQDDFRLEPWALEKAMKVVNENTVVNMYTSIRQEMHQWIIYKDWRNLNDRAWHTRWSSYIMHRDIAQRVLDAPFFRTHQYTYSRNQQLDNALWQVLADLWVTNLYHNPSLTTHIGDSSTIGHKDFLVNKTASKVCDKVIGYIIDDWERRDHVDHNIDDRAKSIERQFDELYLISAHKAKIADQLHIVETVQKTPWYWFLLSPWVNYPQSYVKDVLEWMNKKKWACTTYAWFSLEKWIPWQKLLYRSSQEDKKMQICDSSTFAWYGNILREQQPKSIYDHLDITLSRRVYETTRSAIFMPQHDFGYITNNFTKNIYNEIKYKAHQYINQTYIHKLAKQ